MQKFARKVIAWARFDRVVAFRKKSVDDCEREAQLLLASNIIGRYWKRRIEKKVLAIRFVNRLRVCMFYI